MKRLEVRFVRLSVASLVLLALLALLLCDRWRAGLSPQVIAAEGRTSDEFDRLLQARYETGSRLLEMEEKRLNKGVTTLGHVCEVARWVRDSAVELPGQVDARLSALTNYVVLTRRLEESIERAAATGAASLADKETAHYLRLDAEVALLRAKQRPVL
jgi:hypothetical protein